ncbi:MAG: tRNA uridine-5-carboxymethylaminomethyl(34) synthesis GTPase MnmE [Spirochaetota bacterium]
MNELPYDTNDPIVALATPWAESALAVVRTSGEGVVDLVARAFSRPEELRAAGNATMLYGYIQTDAGPDGERIDEVMAAVFRAPHGYTGQESVEITCHGSLPGIQKILEVLRWQGFRDAAPGEFTMRAFLNGKMDLTRAEAVREIIGAKSRRAQSLALNRLSGALWRRIEGLKQKLKSLLAAVEVQLDYPEDEMEAAPDVPLETLQEIEGQLRQLLGTYRTGRLYQEGVRVALSGATNAGKSSLFNLFLREDRSIVSGVHGTTRDYIESWITIQGVPVRLFDTAGLRDPEHPVEAEGIKRSSRVVESAAVVVYVVDATVGPSGPERADFKAKGGDPRFLFVWNKTDLATEAAPEGFFAVSAQTGAGFEQLEAEIGRRILGSGGGQGDLLIDSTRQHALLQRADASLKEAAGAVEAGMPLDFVAADLKDALDALGEITGEVTSADILNQIFGDFCVGK